ncbi:hypothetical protein TNCT_736171 [Trichonephila clavata]|uniref:Secreted protein n=1 Tax=Trichonephila clavata TaxID=2740835 RepID=A0A8X6I124_TRICU|nr:hypothetical protein TNCT_736171 [Trichonephila clavata]
MYILIITLILLKIPKNITSICQKRFIVCLLVENRCWRTFERPYVLVCMFQHVKLNIFNSYARSKSCYSWCPRCGQDECHSPICWSYV